MGRRELRDEIQATWRVHEPRVAGVPFRKRDLAAAYAKDLPSVRADESSEARCPPASRDSSAPTEGG